MKPEDAPVSLFTSFTLPAALTQADFASLPTFYIAVEGQAIQIEGFSSSADAFAALNAACGTEPTVVIS